MKDNIFDIVIEVILVVLIIFFIPMELYGLEEERVLRVAIENDITTNLENITNQKKITATNVNKLSQELSKYDLNHAMNIEVESDGMLYSYDYLRNIILEKGEFLLGDNDYVEIVVKCNQDTVGVSIAKLFNPSLPDGWIKVIKGNVVNGSRG